MALKGVAQNSAKLEKFLNREEYLNEIKSSINQYKINDNFYKLYFISGIGGIGKTAFSKEVIKINTDDEIKLDIINLTIETNDKLDLLLKIRKTFDYAYDFDYLFLNYWSRHRSAELNSEYKKILEKNIYNVFNKLKDIDAFNDSEIVEYLSDNINISNVLNSKFGSFTKSVGNVISKLNFTGLKIEDIQKIDLDDFGYMIKLSKFIYKTVIDSKLKFKNDEMLTYIDDENFIDKLFDALVDDVNQYNKKKCVIIFDSVDFKEEYFFVSIQDFIGRLNHGIYIVLTRQKQDVSQIIEGNEDSIKCFEINQLPIDVVRDYLHNNFSFSSDTIENIILKTERIPFFLELAVANAKDSNNTNNNDIFEIKNKNDFMKRYINNMDEEMKEFYSIISVVRVFNKEILKELLPKLEYNFDYYSTLDYIQQKDNLEIYTILEIYAENFKISVGETKYKNINKSEVIDRYIKFFYYRILTSNNPKIINVFALNILHLLEDIDAAEINNYIEIIIDTILYAYDTGYLQNIKNQ